MNRVYPDDSVTEEELKEAHTGESEVFNAAQVKLLQSASYSTNILIRAEYQEKNKETGELEDSYTTPHITIVPEKEVVYVVSDRKPPPMTEHLHYLAAHRTKASFVSSIFNNSAQFVVE